MNRLVLIGNGFDLAHGLKTSYKDFFYWYWSQRFNNIHKVRTKTAEDILCSMTTLGYDSWYYLMFYNHVQLSSYDGRQLYEMLNNENLFAINYNSLLDNIRKSIETKGWVDIENEYYDLLKNYVLKHVSIPHIESLNEQLQFLQSKLVEYLNSIEISDKLLKSEIRQKIYAPINLTDISIESEQALIDHLSSGMSQDENCWNNKLRQYASNCYSYGYVSDYKKKFSDKVVLNDELPDELLLPNQIMLLSFNYTHTPYLYCKDGSIFSVNQIHGDLNNPKSVIFGYGDELDENYKTLVDKNENIFLGNIKSIKYLEADNYRKMLSFIESEPYQILIMGHSCGNSDRTLLNTLFEHKNCVSIKPYYYQKDNDHDNYIELIQNISRNFKDMKLMRDRVVNKTYCEPLTRNN